MHQMQFSIRCTLRSNDWINVFRHQRSLYLVYENVYVSYKNIKHPEDTIYTSNALLKKELLEVEIERLSFAIILLSSSFAKIECVARNVVHFL